MEQRDNPPVILLPGSAGNKVALASAAASTWMSPKFYHPAPPPNALTQRGRHQPKKAPSESGEELQRKL